MRTAGGDPEELSLRIELVEQRVEVALVDPAAVEEDQGALGLARRAPERTSPRTTRPANLLRR